MGRTFQLLSENKIDGKTIFDKRLVVECCETFHLHWRNLRLEFSHENFIVFIKTVLEAYNAWTKNGSPVSAHHLELGRGLIFPSLCTPQDVKIEVCENLYKKHENSRDSEFLIEDEFIHIHYRDLRIEMSKEEFVGLAESFVSALNNFNQSSRSLKELFDILNRSNIVYTVLRNWENLPDNVALGSHSDLDLIVHPQHIGMIKQLWNLTPTHSEPHRVQYKCPVRNGNLDSFILCDIRSTNDGYYPEDFSNKLLNMRIKEKNFFILPPDLHFYALVYHVVYHKGVVSADYAEKIINLSKIIGIDFQESQCYNLSYLISLLNERNIYSTAPVDVSVLPSMPFLGDAGTVMYSKVLTEINGTGIQSRIYKLEDKNTIRVIKQATANLAKREFHILNSFSNQYFPEVLNLKEYSNYSSFEMNWINGYPLSDLQFHSDEWNESSAENFLTGCLSILLELKKNKILHRDIKPNNIFVRDFKPVLIDFGWAVYEDENFITPPGLGDWGRPPDGSFSDAYSMAVSLLELVYHFPKYSPVVLTLIEQSLNKNQNPDYDKLLALVKECSNVSAMDYRSEIIDIGVTLKIPAFVNNHQNKIEITDLHIPDLLLESERFIEEGNYHEAKKYLLKILKAHPENPDALNNLAVIFILTNDYKAALETLHKVISADPLNETALENFQFLKQNLSESTDTNILNREADSDYEASVIIPVYNNSSYTRDCLLEIFSDAESSINFEVIVVDNASSDDTASIVSEFQKQHPGFRYIKNEENLGFAKACNIGAGASKGKLLVFLNNDTKSKPGWLGKLISRLNSDDKIGIVGAKLLYPDNTIQHCGIKINQINHAGFEYWPGHIHRGAAADDIQCNKPGEVEAVTGACLAISKHLFENAGRFDENYGMYFEDIDLCMAVKTLGYKIFYEPSCEVIHYEGKSSPSQQIIDRQNISSAKYFFEKWQSLFPPVKSKYLLERTVLWASPVFNPSGYASEAIAFALGMYKYMDLQILHDNPNYSNQFVNNLPDNWKKILKHLSRNTQNGSINVPTNTIFISHQPAHSFKKFNSLSYNIGRTMFETDSIPADWVQSCNEMDEIWVPTSFNYYTFLKAGVKREKLFIVPEAIDTDVFNPDVVKPYPLTDKACFNFLSVFEWTERKGADLLLRAYFETFTSKDDVCLYIRAYIINNYDSNTTEEINNRIDSIIRKYRFNKQKLPRYVIIDEQLTMNEMLGLYKAVDAFVLPSRGEGWGRPYMEAMSMGLPVIGTNWSGNTAFMNNDNSYLINVAGLSVIKNMELEIYKGQKWAMPDRKHLCSLMRFVFENKDAAKQKGQAARTHIVENFNLDSVARTAANRLKEIENHLNNKIHPVQKRKEESLSINWQGAFFANHSLALVNREITTRLVRENVELYLTPTETNKFFPESNVGQAALLSLMNSEPEKVDLNIRHQWPPDLAPPQSGKWIIIQPWEFGSLPIDWVSVFNSQVDELWVPSDYVRKVYIDSGIIPGKVKVIPNGIDPARFHPEVKPLKLKTKKQFKFLFVGGTIFRKGIDILLDAYTNSFNSKDDVALVIKDFGGNSVYKDQTIKNKILSLKKDSSTPEILYMDKTLTDAEMASLYKACDVLVHPYRGEGFGLPILESMASGIPAIVTNGGSCLDFCNDNNSLFISARIAYLPENKVDNFITASRPWLYEPSVEDLKVKLKFAFQHPNKMKNLGANARNFVINNFTWQNTCSLIMNRFVELKYMPVVRFQNKNVPGVPRQTNELVNQIF